MPEDIGSHIQEDANASKSEIPLDPNDSVGGKAPKQKNKKGKSKGDTEVKEASQEEDTEDNLLHEYQQKIVKEDQRTSSRTRVKGEDESAVSQSVTLSNDVGKKKKKKMKSVVTDSDAGCV